MTERMTGVLSTASSKGERDRVRFIDSISGKNTIRLTKGKSRGFGNVFIDIHFQALFFLRPFLYFLTKCYTFK